MKNVISCIVTAAVCGGIGFYAGWRLGTKFAYKDIQKQINEIKEVYKNDLGTSHVIKTDEATNEHKETHEDNSAETEDKDSFLRHKPDSFAVHYDQYASIVQRYNHDAIVPGQETPPIYLINDSEFGELEDDGYMTQSLVWYTDNIMAEYQTDEMVDNLEDAIGTDWLNVFNDGEDFVYVRNKVRQCDYEIIRSAKSYTEDVLPTKPPTMEERNDL